MQKLSQLSWGSMVWLLILVAIVGCSNESVPSSASKNKSESSADQSKVEKISLLLNWYPEAEHGGYYAALVHGIFKKHGLDVEIKPGGKTTVVPQELTIGRIQFGVGNADDVLMAREQTASLVALMAPMQMGPRCIMVREDSGIQSFEDLKNLTLQIDPARPYIPFMLSKGLLKENVKTVPYFGTVAQLVSDKRTAQQAYSFSEPLMAEQQGIKVRNLMMSDIGYNPYASVLISTEEYLAKRPEIATKMVAACVEGWGKYLESPEETNRYILLQNRQGMTEEALVYGVANLKPLCIPPGFDASQLGAMELGRWTTLANQLRDLGMISEKVKPAEAFSTDYLPTR
ncbi:MAG: ABC transporter substrate-binding protein [Pirellulaceae bacterium]|nr:ABC transporter substrate-binding protein [Pirellulaceae bacterium]